MLRKDFRTNCMIEKVLEYTFYQEDLSLKFHKKITIKIIDISATGIKFKSSGVLKMDECFRLEFLIRNDLIHVFAKINRLIKEKQETIYAASFIKTKESTEVNM